MRSVPLPVLLVGVLASVVLLMGPHAPARMTRTLAPTELPLPARDAGLRFAPGTNPVDQQAVLSAVASAGPEARRLIDLVDGTVTIEVGRTGMANAAGVAHVGPGNIVVALDLGLVSPRFGMRGVTRLTLHELAHVVDYLLVPPDLKAALDATVPAGYPCAAGDTDSSCAGRSEREERFAESFAKWATGDIGLGLDFGYRVPPPLSLAGWGTPLSAITGRE